MGPRLANVPPLEIAGEDHVRPFVQDIPLMHVAEGPVVIALVDEVIECAGRIIRVVSHAAESRMKDTDVERALHRLRIIRDQIVGHVAPREALAVQRHAELVEREGLGLT